MGLRTELDDGKSAGSVAALSVTELLDRYADCEPFICKIDVEGAEQELFSTNTQWVSRFPMVIIELHDWLFPRSANSANFLRVIADMDRDFVLNGENIFSISNRMTAREKLETKDALTRAGIGA